MCKEVERFESRIGDALNIGLSQGLEMPLYSGNMDQVDSFRISEVDLTKYSPVLFSFCFSGRKSANHLKMKLLANYLIGSSNDIHNQLYSERIYSFDNQSSFSNGVMPLQNYTNESYQVSHSELSEVSEVGPCLHYSNSHSLAGTQFDTNSWGYMDNRQSLVCNDGKCSADGYLSNRRKERRREGKTKEEKTRGEKLQSFLFSPYLTSRHDPNRLRHALDPLVPDLPIKEEIFFLQRDRHLQEEAEENVHVGAPPPWFDATEENPLNEQITLLLLAIRKFQLNPKWAGAAWEGKRKIEMERKEEIVTNNFDSWQSGSLKESRKEFKVENKNSPRVELQSETSIKIQPYISKQMMQVNDTFGGDHVKRITDGLDFEPLDLKYWFILNSRLDGAIILFVMRGKIMDGFSLKLSS
ncbi:hypothetical protein HYC85_029124 [Camellia sinensis]|uniref:Uncharacterized protein n=1 Tax=Camellia sinensis TaxID=4442 RepID=A0A7J7FX35_CAMSI|nr:hypothetical protein HYC85_029124 [Camellia sinensis]